ncbi:MAG TPA: amino acid-binding protein [Rhizobiales bacterium]|nr:amino acid-binding protein [Hyphomicrobiales bacterium]
MEMVLTVIARDRPGLVEALAKVISGHQGNWVDSAMSRLGGEFAGIVKISVPGAQLDSLKYDLAALSNQGIRVTYETDTICPLPAGNRARLEVMGQDHKGIVRDISRVLAENSVNVESLNTNVFSGSMSGEAMFSAKAEIILPDDLDLDDLCAALEEIAGDLMAEVELKKMD